MNHTYKLKRLTNGHYYIVRTLSKKGFKKWEQGKLQTKSGIIELSDLLYIAIIIISLSYLTGHLIWWLVR